MSEEAFKHNPDDGRNMEQLLIHNPYLIPVFNNECAHLKAIKFCIIWSKQMVNLTPQIHFVNVEKVQSTSALATGEQDKYKTTACVGGAEA